MSKNKKRIMLTLDEDVAKKFDEVAKQMGFSKSALVTAWINGIRNNSDQKK